MRGLATARLESRPPCAERQGPRHDTRPAQVRALLERASGKGAAAALYPCGMRDYWIDKKLISVALRLPSRTDAYTR